MTEQHPATGQRQAPAAATAGRVKWLLRAGLALTLVATANLGYLIYGAVLACQRYDGGGPSPLFGLTAARVRWGVGAMLFGALSMLCAMLALRRARGRYVSLALLEIALGGLPLLVVLAVYWAVWRPM